MKNHKILIFSSLLIGLALLVSACAVAPTGGEVVDDVMEEDAMMEGSTLVEITLTTGSTGSGLAFFGQGGEIDGQENPVLSASVGDTVRITLVNGDGMPHDIFLPDLSAQSTLTTASGQQVVLEFKVSDAGEFIYFCTIDGHRAAGMEGTLVVAP
jgi:plastocyanin